MSFAQGALKRTENTFIVPLRVWSFTKNIKSNYHKQGSSRRRCWPIWRFLEIWLSWRTPPGLRWLWKMDFISFINAKTLINRIIEFSTLQNALSRNNECVLAGTDIRKLVIFKYFFNVLGYRFCLKCLHSIPLIKCYKKDIHRTS